jgi:PIN domain nuclease of toxin-antitoxin system
VSSILLDTHSMVWLIGKSSDIGSSARRDIINAPAVFVSIVSVWELAIKHSLGKFKNSPDEIIEGARVAGIIIAPMSLSAISELASVDIKQKDPFDRMIVAQAKAENMKLYTADKLILEGFDGAVDVTK